MAAVFSCSVFPDEATLPSAAAGAATGGSSVLPVGGAGGDGVDRLPLGGVGGSEGGAPSLAGAGASAGAPPLGGAGAPDVVGGAGGAGGAVTCAAPQRTVVAVTADTWIEAADPTMGHGDDSVLSVVGGGQERRALLQMTLPAAPVGAVLLKATLVLHLQANADVTLAGRQLRLHQLEQAVIESRATWNKFSNGSKGDWRTPGGDFGDAVGQAAVPVGTSVATLSLNVTALVRSISAATPVPLSLILLETSAPPPPPAELAFTSTEGDASGVPALIVDYCEP